MYWSCIWMVGLAHKLTIWIPNHLKSQLQIVWYSNVSCIQMVYIFRFPLYQKVSKKLNVGIWVNWWSMYTETPLPINIVVSGIVYIFFREEFPFIGIFFCFCHRCWTAGVRQVSTQLLWNSEILLANDSVANHLQAPPIKGSDFGTMSVGLFGQWGAANHTNIACSRSFGAFAFYIYHPVSARPSIRITTE